MGPIRSLPVVITTLASLAAALLTGVPAAASHPPGRWTGYGPSGGTVGNLQIGPDGTLYAGTGGNGVFASTNAGLAWQRRGGGLPPDVLVSEIAVSAASATRVYLSSYAHGAWRSDDAGLTWQRIHQAATIADVAVDPTNADIVYLGDAAGANFKSTNGGATWTQVTIPNQTHFGSDVVEISPSNPRVIYASDPPLLRRSDDAGATWQGLYGYLTHVNDVGIHPTNPMTVYAATEFDGVRRSTDGGKTWTTGSGLPDIAAYAVAVDRSQPSTVYASTARPGYLYRSLDSGATWQPLRVAGATGAIHEIVFASDGTLYVGVDNNGVLRSADRGVTWTRRMTGLAGNDVRDLLVMTAAPDTVFAGTYGDGVHRSGDGGHKWTRRGLAGRIVNDLSAPRWAMQTVYAATDKGVYKTTDGGLNWRQTTPGLIAFTGVAVAPSNSNIVYAVNWASVYKSTDAGQTWNALDVPRYVRYLSVAVHPTNHSMVWVGAYQLAHTILRSTDGGATWRSALACSEAYGPEDIAVDVRQPTVLFAGCQGSGGVFRSTDSGATWRVVSPPSLNRATAVVVHPFNSQTVYAGTYTGDGISGVYRSLDRGGTWQLFTTGMTTTWIHALAITPTASTLHAGTTGYGLSGGGGGVFSRPLP